MSNQNGLLLELEQPIIRRAKALEELTPLWPEARPVPLWWDMFRNVFSAPRRYFTYRSLFGTYWVLRNWEGIQPTAMKALRLVSPGRWSRPLQRAFCLPEDATLLSLRNGDKIVVASAKSNLVLKLGYDVKDIKNEVRAWSIIQEAGVESHVPAVLDHGTTSDGGQWVLTELASNKDPLRHPLNPRVDAEARWRALMREGILPMMERFYEASGVEILDIDDLLEEQKERLRHEDAPKPVLQLMRLAEEARPAGAGAKAVQAEIHADLHPGNIHRDGSDWNIIDWGMLRRDEVSIDTFVDYFWSFDSPHENHRGFWAWLRGEASLSQLPSALRADVEHFIGWQASWQGIPSDANPLRFLLLTHLFRRTVRRTSHYNLAALLENGAGEEEMQTLAPSSRSRADRVVGQLRALHAFG